MSKQVRRELGARKFLTALFLTLSLFAVGACDSLLEVDLPSELTEDALADPSGAADQVNSAISNFECGYSTWAYFIAGDEDVMDPQNPVYWPTGGHRYSPQGRTGKCDETEQDVSYFTAFLVSRSQAESIYGRLNGEDAWTVQQVPDKERLSAIAALYAAANFEYLGEFFCDNFVDGGPLLTPDETLAIAEDWVETAESHIAATGDFELPHGLTVGGGAEAMAAALKARIRWARGDLSGAAAAAENVPMGFEALVTREGGLDRRNKVFQQGRKAGYSRVQDVVHWWEGAPNPATGEEWPDVIPFTGYLSLGILSDGRAVWDDNQLPVRVEGTFRGEPLTGRRAGDDGAIADPRLPVEFSDVISGGGFLPVKYPAEDTDIPFLTWEEIWLIRAEAAGGQTAIDLVNDIRDFYELPRVTYADPGDPDQIRNMILEEARRVLWLEGGRWKAWKIQNTDVAWFPRAQGETFSAQVPYEGAVRHIYPENEYELNENVTLADRATGCDPAEAPVRF